MPMFRVTMAWNSRNPDEGTWCEEIDAQCVDTADERARAIMLHDRPKSDPNRYMMIDVERVTDKGRVAWLCKQIREHTEALEKELSYSASS